MIFELGRRGLPGRRRPPLTRRRRVPLLALLLCVLLAAASCSSAEPGTSSGPVTLTYGIWDAAQRPAMQQIVDSFERQHPDIKVRIALTPWDTYWTKLQTAATGGSAPDVFWMLNDHFPLYASGGALLQLDDQIKDAKLNLADYVPSSAAGVQWDGHVYGIPKDTNSFGLFYNKALFKAAGVAPPDASWTWADVVTAAQRLTDRKKGVYGVAAPVNDVLSYYLTIPQAGGQVISPDGRSSGYADPGSIEGLRFWTDLIQRYHVSPTAQQLSDTDPVALFTAGKIAMYYGGSWDPIAIAAIPAGSKNTGIAPLPKGRNASFYANGIANVAFAKTEHPEQAWEFLRFLGSGEAADLQARSGAVIPALKGHEDAYVRAFPQFHMQALVDQLPNAKPIPASRDTARWEDFATREFTRAWAGQTSVEEAARTVADQMNRDLSKEAKGG
jgi:multiple sugar transport system substrate-binding protein